MQLDSPRFNYLQTDDGAWVAKPTVGYLMALRTTYSARECEWLATLPHPENIIDNAHVRGWHWFTLDDYYFLREMYGQS